MFSYSCFETICDSRLQQILRCNNNGDRQLLFRRSVDDKTHLRKFDRLEDGKILPRNMKRTGWEIKFYRLFLMVNRALIMAAQKSKFSIEMIDQ